MSSTAEVTANRLRTEVLSGCFNAFGILPPISEIVRQYETSRYLVEQAIKRLQEEGLLVMKNKRVFVAGISLEQQKPIATANKPPLIPSPVCEQPFYVYTHSYPEGILAPDGYDLSSVVFYVGKGTVVPPHQIQRVDIHEREARCLSDSQLIYSACEGGTTGLEAVG